MLWLLRVPGRTDIKAHPFPKVIEPATIEAK